LKTFRVSNLKFFLVDLLLPDAQNNAKKACQKFAKGNKLPMGDLGLC